MNEVKRVSAEPLLSRMLHSEAAKQGLAVSGTFELTPRCNFNCRMCYIHCKDNILPDGKRERTAEEWLDIARAARDGGTVFMLLTGGEPLLYKDFKYLFHELKQLGMLVSINTNGSLLFGELLDFLISDPPTRLNVTLYGASEETYEKICGVRMFSRVVENIKAAKAAGLSVRLNCSLTPDNAHDLHAIFELSRQLDVFVKASSYMFLPVRLPGQTESPDARFTPELAGEYLLGCREEVSLPEEILKYTAEACVDESAEPNPGGIRCRAGRTSYWITWDGRMLPCGMMELPGQDVAELGFSKAWENVKAFTAGVRTPAECSVCSYQRFCPVCAAMCRAETGNFNIKPDYISRMTKAMRDKNQEKYGKNK